MKYSKQIPIWRRKKLWSEFIKYRKFEFNNNFEQLCYKYIQEL
jgi:hypothetical protein